MIFDDNNACGDADYPDDAHLWFRESLIAVMVVAAVLILAVAVIPFLRDVADIVKHAAYWR